MQEETVPQHFNVTPGSSDDDAEEPIAAPNALQPQDFTWRRGLSVRRGERCTPLGQQLRLAGRDLQVWSAWRGEGGTRRPVRLALSRCASSNEPYDWLLKGGGEGHSQAASVTWEQRTISSSKAKAHSVQQLFLSAADHFLLELMNRAAHEALVKTKFAPRLPGEDPADPEWDRDGVQLSILEEEADQFLLSLCGRATVYSGRSSKIRAGGCLRLLQPAPPAAPRAAMTFPAWQTRAALVPPAHPSLDPRPEALHPVLGACYIVHMASQQDREPNVCKLCALAEEAGVPCRVLDAVDGRAMAPPETPVEPFWDYSRRPVKVREHLRPGEVGCLLSHVQAWARIASDPAPGGHVLEDDAVLDPQAFEVWERAAAALADEQPPAVVYADRGWPRALAWEDLEYEPLLPHAPARRILCTKYCTAAYWISRGAARQLLFFAKTRAGGGWLPSDDLMSVAAGVHLGLRTPEMEHLAPLRKSPLVHLYHTEPRTLVTLAVDYGETEPAREPVQQAETARANKS